jgi:hypothetical protein
MARTRYVPEDVGVEVCAPSGYYQPLEEALIDYHDRPVLYVLGVACIEASCCGTGDWQYLRVEGYVVQGGRGRGGKVESPVEIETIEDEGEKRAIGELLLERHPGAKIEFR